MRPKSRSTTLTGTALWALLLLGHGTVPHAGTNPQLQQIPANEWIPFHVEQDATWDRQPHAGVVYDSKRGTILMFGAETHGYSSDNSVREFDPATRTWTEHYPPSDTSTYRADAQGRCIAGAEGVLRPPAMHTYDAMVYDPVRDAMIVGSTPAHNPDVPIVYCDYRNTWLYDLATRRWSILDNGGMTPPTAFARAMAYDPVRQTTVLYASRLIGELPSTSDRWLTTASAYQGEIHYMLECIPTDGKCYLFGDYMNSDRISAYTPGATPGTAGTWETRTPQGDAIPADQTFPVAYDPDQQAFLLVTQRDGATETYVYDPITDRMTLMPSTGGFQTEAMNYMMVYDDMNGVFLAITGSWLSPTTVWALRLERKPPPPEDWTAYACLFLCGTAADRSAVADGTYRTVVNIHNPNFGWHGNEDLTLLMKAVTARPPDEAPGAISNRLTKHLPPAATISVDCADIRTLLGPGDDFIHGFVAVEVPPQPAATGTPPALDVVGVYTASRSTADAVNGNDGESTATQSCSAIRIQGDPNWP